jgi:hypothetical protein
LGRSSPKVGPTESAWKWSTPAARAHHRKEPRNDVTATTRADRRRTGAVRIGPPRLPFPTGRLVLSPDPAAQRRRSDRPSRRALSAPPPAAVPQLTHRPRHHEGTAITRFPFSFSGNPRVSAMTLDAGHERRGANAQHVRKPEEPVNAQRTFLIPTPAPDVPSRSSPRAPCLRGLIETADQSPE